MKPAAKRDLASLPPDTRARIRPKIDALADDPRPPGVKKLVGAENRWRIRVGDYRVIYEIHDKALLVLVVRIRHRSGAY
ncbi:MAG: type II toxin-antitoxin system RelE/ParE family toxin [Planctomycetes bacterium]|nr:type II toxin-antitoxin system RelE/ParE family toxin [Planctomycetota bacterium]